MFYKFEDGEWSKGNKVYFPDGTILSEDNKIIKDGWEWHDVQPYEEVEL